MKLLAYFDAFMKNTVNLDDSRLRELDDHVDAIYGTLTDDDELGPLVLNKDPQGSWPQLTIIKPIAGNEFDADFMLVMEEQPGWTPRQYIDAVFRALGRHGTYKEKTKKKNRCVRVVYAHDCHVDIVPFVKLADGRQVIANYETDDWEETDPDEFTAWMKQKDDTAQGNLRRVIRLMKYLRDHHLHFKSTRSVILTILLGERVDAAKKQWEPDYYRDLPTTFVHLLEDLKVWMDSNPILPPLPDPSGANNDFNHRWNQESYDNLRSKVATLAGDARTALDAGLDESHELWKKVFGSDFKKPSSVSAAAAKAGSSLLIPSVQSGRDG
jgi:Second Messenger Oligonucleotide or Dinucleotide Synthetase domain